jgi:hypothetical protein
MFGLNNQLGGANKAVGVADMANELDKLDGADKANVIVKVNKIIAVNNTIWFCCMFSLRMQDQFQIDNQPDVIIGKRFTVKETFVFICRQMGGATHLVWLKNGAQKLAGIGVCFVVDEDLTFEIAEI